MTAPDLRTNPDASPGASAPLIGRYRVNGTTLYAEVRGAGPAILLIPGGAEDAEGWRAIAERLTGHTVVTYDRRGTLRSGREDWPGGGSAQHADDAAGLLGALGLGEALVFGASSAGIVAVQLALRHPALVGRTLVYEPGYFGAAPDGRSIQRLANEAIEAHLASHPGDWVGAYEAFARAAVPVDTADPHGFLAPPAGKAWYAQREDLNAEALVRDDIPILTAEPIDRAALAASPVEMRFSHGTGSLAVFRDIATALAELRGAVPDVIDGVAHSIYFQPDIAAAYIDSHVGP